MVAGPEKTDDMAARRIADRLLDQLTEMNELYNFGEKLYAYENIREGQPEINEDARRR